MIYFLLLSVCSRRIAGANQRAKGRGGVSKAACLRLRPAATSDAHLSLSNQQLRSSYVICNSEGAVLRRSTAIVKANAEIIAQVREILVRINTCSRHIEYPLDST